MFGTASDSRNKQHHFENRDSTSVAKNADLVSRQELIAWALERQKECRQRSDEARLMWCTRYKELIEIERQLEDMIMCRKFF